MLGMQEMDLNKIKLLKKQELLQKLNQIGFGEVAKMLEDKDISGQTLIELREFEIFKWKLSLSQKKILWNSIKEIKNSPSILMIPETPKIIKKSVVNERNVSDIESCKEFKEKLKDLLGGAATSVGRPSTLPKMSKNKPLPPLLDDNDSTPLPTRQKRINPNLKTQAGAGSHSSKPLPPLPLSPSSSPSLQNNNCIKNTRISVAKEPALSLPNETQLSDQTYLQMYAPTKPINENYNGDYYLTPLDIPGSVMNNLPSLPTRTPSPKAVQSDRSQFYSAKSSVKTASSSKENLSIDSCLGSLSPLHNNIRNSLTKSNGNNNNNKNTTPILGKRYSSDMTAVEDVNIYELPNQESNFTNVNNGKGTSSRDTGNNNKVPILDEIETQQDLKSLLTSTVNIFKMGNKGKGANKFYENHLIEGAKHKQVEMTLKNRPLPKIPSSNIPSTTLFSRPFPPPRNISPDSDPQYNYVELINPFSNIEKPSPAAEDLLAEKQIQNPLNTGQSDDLVYSNTSEAEQNKQAQLCKNTSKTKNLVNQPIYGNTSNEDHLDYKHTMDVHEAEDLLAEQLQNSLKTKQSGGLETFETEQNEQGQIYENTSKTKNLVEQPIYGNTPNGDHLNYKRTVDVHEPTSTSMPRLKQSMVGLPKDLNIRKNSKEERSTAVNTVDNYQGLAFLLAQKLKERNQRKQSQDELEASETDSEFENDSPIYGNISNDESKPSSGEGSVEHVSTSQLKKIPIYKWDLPKIPKESTSQNTAPTTNSVTLRTKQDDKSSKAAIPSKNFTNSDSEADRKNSVTNIFNLNEEQFYRNTDRKGAKLLLSKLGDGAFLFRPSRTYFLVLTIKQSGKIYNFGIERSVNNMLRLITEGDMIPPEFSTLKDFVDYFSEEPVTFGYGGELTEIYLKPSLMPN